MTFFFFGDALQIRFNPGGNAAIVADVLSGITDVGFARTDTIYSFKPGLRLLMHEALRYWCNAALSY